jgi:actin-related protein 6
MGTLLLDHGASLLRFGTPDSQPSSAYNCVAKSKRSPFVFGPTSLAGLSEVYRPVQQGVIVNFELQRKVWQKVLNAVDCSQTDLLLAVSPYTPASVLQSLDQMVFEDFKFRSYRRVKACPVQTGLYLDLGFSSCSVLPVVGGNLLNYAVQRVGVGGKLLTNFMKERISFRHFDMTEETWLVDHIKQTACYVSLDFETELAAYK